MNWKQIKELQEKKAALKAEAEKIHARSATGVKPEDQKEYDTVLADIEVCNKRIENAQKLVALAGEGKEEETRSVTPTVENKANSLDEQRKEFQRAILTSSVGSSNVAPQYFADSFTTVLSTKVGMLNVGCLVKSTPTGNPYQFPTCDDTANSASVRSEGATASAATDPTLANVTLNSYCYSSGVIKVSEEMLRDNFLDVEQEILRIGSDKIARKIAYDTVNGDGSNKITGFLSGIAASCTAAAGVTAGATAGGPIAYSDLTNLVYQLDAGHRSEGVILASTSAVSAMANMVNGNGNLIWAPGVERKVEGLPIREIQDMPSVSLTASHAVAVVNPKRYAVRLVGAPRIKMSREKYFEEGKVAVIVEQYADGKWIDSNACKVLSTHT